LRLVVPIKLHAVANAMHDTHACLDCYSSS
jgi:hypothetical protein